MKTKQFYTGVVSLSIAVALALLDLTTIKASFTDPISGSSTVYPAAFFALLGLLLIYHSVKPLWHK